MLKCSCLSFYRSCQAGLGSVIKNTNESAGFANAKIGGWLSNATKTEQTDWGNNII